MRALSVRFRARFLARVRAVVPAAPIPATVWQTPWVVYCKAPVQGGDRVLRYHARYVHRVALTDGRILAADATCVRFRYQEARTRVWRTMTLAPAEFLRRYLQHILPRGFHKVRYYGFWRPRAAAVRTRLQATLAAASTSGSPSSPRAASTSDDGTTPRERLARRCPSCHVGTLRLVGRQARGTRARLPLWLAHPP